MALPATPTLQNAGTGPTDLVLVQAAMRGEPAAVDQLVVRLGCVVRFVYRLNRMLGFGLPTEAQEDVVQQVYAVLWPRLRDFTGHNALETWIYGFCRNCLRSEIRRRGSQARTMPLADQLEPSAHDVGPDLWLARREQLEALQEELAALPPEEADAVRLRHLEGQSFEDIARRQGAAASTIKDRCYRAMQHLEHRLQRRLAPEREPS